MNIFSQNGVSVAGQIAPSRIDSRKTIMSLKDRFVEELEKREDVGLREDDYCVGP